MGHELSFAYDIADLYKAELTIPIAFEIAANPPKKDFTGTVRRRIRDRMVQMRLLERMVRDLKELLKDDPNEHDDMTDVLYLWDEKKAGLPADACMRMMNHGRILNDRTVPVLLPS